MAGRWPQDLVCNQRCNQQRTTSEGDGVGMLKLGVIGAGLIGQKHVELVAAHGACDLVALCDANPAAAAVALRYGSRFFQDYRTLLGEVPLDGVIIAAPTPFHTEIGIACAEQGIPMLVEKPLAATLTEARALLTVAEHRTVPILVGHHRRHNPLVQEARRIVQSGTLGNLVAVSALFTLRKPADYFQVAWRAQPGGGPILINLIHDIDNLRFICGEIACVFGMTSSINRNFAVEDTAGITVRFANGALGSLLLSDVTAAPWSYELTSRENPAYPPTGGLLSVLWHQRLAHLSVAADLALPAGRNGWMVPAAGRNAHHCGTCRSPCGAAGPFLPDDSWQRGASGQRVGWFQNTGRHPGNSRIGAVSTTGVPGGIRRHLIIGLTQPLENAAQASNRLASGDLFSMRKS
ncbi:MAG: Gfo/Idh/MocA family oxidoreductase [Caldilineaceae bacterium]